MTNGGVDPASGDGPVPFRPISVGPPGPGGGRRAEERASKPSKPPKGLRDGRRLDRFLGIFIGIVLGIGIVTAFVFLGSEDQIDAPRISTTGTQDVAPPASEQSP